MYKPRRVLNPFLKHNHSGGNENLPDGSIVIVNNPPSLLHSVLTETASQLLGIIFQAIVDDFREERQKKRAIEVNQQQLIDGYALTENDDEEEMEIELEPPLPPKKKKKKKTLPRPLKTTPSLHEKLP